MRLSIVFIGGKPNGKIVLEYLLKNKYVEVPFIITYPEDYDTPRNIRLNKDKRFKTIYESDANKLTAEIKEAKPDFIFVAGWSGLLSEELIKIPTKGTVGFHPSKLPSDRGRSVLAWQIEEGYRDSALTMFYYNELPDCGDIIAQEMFKINHNDYISDVMNKVDNATYNLMRAYFPLLRQGIAPRKLQNINEGNFRRLRNDRDSLINWDSNTAEIYNKIRAISKPYPGAFFIYENTKVKVWKSDIISDHYVESLSQNLKPGNVISRLYDNSYLIKCRDGILKIYIDKDMKPGNEL